MNPTEIEFAVKDLVSKPYDAATFPFDLIAIYNAPKITVTKLKSGQTNAAVVEGDVLWKRHLFFRSVGVTEDVAAAANLMARDPLTTKHKPRFIITTNGAQVHIRDLKLDDSCDVDFETLDEESYFLLPLAGFERRAAIEEHPADIKAAKRLKKLYDAILSANPTWSAGHHTHELNVLMTRLLFCFYAEDTAIFDTPQVLTDTLTQYTQEDGSDLSAFLDRLFMIMNVKESLRAPNTPSVERKFPYVNGSLFESTLEVPRFNRTARRLLLECGQLDWTTINPDIFGSMIQTIAQPGSRVDVGMHYTSVPNIMNVLQPLLLDDLSDAFEKAKDSLAKLEGLLQRLSRIRIFDPACGSGNFLVIAYKELRKREMRVLARIAEIAPNSPLRLSNVSINHFYGMDIVDFACEIAKLSLWIAEHQMNCAFKDMFGKAKVTLPLAKLNTVHNASALSVPWSSICPIKEGTETFVCGNPPYQGSVGQTVDQKRDIAAIFSPIVKSYRDVDYVACWFVLLAQYITKSDTVRGAFVATNSITQGEQVPFLWPYILGSGSDIFTAHRSFKWGNSASHNAGVTCVIVGLANKNAIKRRTLYTGDLCQEVSHINPYLVPASTPIVTKEQTPLSDIPEMTKGSVINDKGHLTLSRYELEMLQAKYPAVTRFVRRFYGADELLYDTQRYVLWIPDDELQSALAIPPVASRVAQVRKHRLNGGTSARAVAHVPHKFGFISYLEANTLVLPQTSSERRHYLPVSMLGPMDLPSQKLCVIYNPPSFMLSLLSSRLHILWLATIGGRMRTDFSYSNTVVYNTFPIPAISEAQKKILAENARHILRARASHPGKTLAWLYNPETMPQTLLEAHEQNDAYIEEFLYGRKFRDDTHRLEHLFALYGRMKASQTKRATEKSSDPVLLKAK